MHCKNIVRLATTVLFTGLVAGCGDVPSDDSEGDPQALIGGSVASSTQYRSTLALRYALNGTWQLGCTAARVGPRHILTAAHCVHTTSGTTAWGVVRDGYWPGRQFQLSSARTLNSTAPWSTMTVAATYMHPSWVSACLWGCSTLATSSPSMVSPYAADVALIVTTTDLPASILTARVNTNPVGVQQWVGVLGYGCEVAANLAPTTTPRLKYRVTWTQNLANAPFERAYIRTPGRSQWTNEASLCPGDSGGPVYLGSSTGSLEVVGVNANYFFPSSSSGVSYQNTHTRLGADNSAHAVGTWLRTILPVGRVVGP